MTDPAATAASDAPAEFPHRRAWLVASLCLLSLPFLFVTYVPSSDLPQHVAQIRLVEEIWKLRPATLDTSPMRTQPFAPNTFIYWPMFLLGRILAPRLVGKVTAWLLMVSAAFALHYFARRRNRDPIYAFLACAFLFSAPFYWGFFNFLSGLPFWLWFVARALESRDRQKPAPRQEAFDALLLVVLYWTHVLWFAAAGLVTAVLELQVFDWRRTLRRALVFIPIGIPIALWYPKMIAARDVRFDVGPVYGMPFTFHVIIFVLLSLGALASWRNARQREAENDRTLFLLAYVLLSFAFLAPDKYANTILFNMRFMPIGLMFYLLSFAVEERQPLRIAAVTAFVLFVGYTTWTWSAFNRQELTGLSASLDRASDCRRTVGLDYLRESSRYFPKTRPFLQMAAWVQALHGGDLEFSFTAHDSSLVADRQPRQEPWTSGLEWKADEFKRSDVAFFDCYLVDGDAKAHARFVEVSGLPAQPGSDNFRLYRKP